MTTSSIS